MVDVFVSMSVCVLVSMCLYLCGSECLTFSVCGMVCVTDECFSDSLCVSLSVALLSLCGTLRRWVCRWLSLGLSVGRSVCVSVRVCLYGCVGGSLFVSESDQNIFRLISRLVRVRFSSFYQNKHRGSMYSK